LLDSWGEEQLLSMFVLLEKYSHIDWYDYGLLPPADDNDVNPTKFKKQRSQDKDLVLPKILSLLKILEI